MVVIALLTFLLGAVAGVAGARAVWVRWRSGVLLLPLCWLTIITGNAALVLGLSL